MTGWRIEPAGLNRILTETDTAVKSVGTALQGPADSVGEVQAAGIEARVASPRVLIPILEMHQNADGSVTVPEVLRPFMGKDRIGAPS